MDANELTKEKRKILVVRDASYSDSLRWFSQSVSRTASLPYRMFIVMIPVKFKIAAVTAVIVAAEVHNASNPSKESSVSPVQQTNTDPQVTQVQACKHKHGQAPTRANTGRRKRKSERSATATAVSPFCGST